MPDKKSQLAMEFIFLIGFLLLISLGFIIAAAIQMSDFREEKQKESIEDLTLSVKRELDLASAVKEGYSRNLILPEQIDGWINYTITVSYTTLIIKSGKYEYTALIPTLEGELKKGNNLLQNKNRTVVITNT